MFGTFVLELLAAAPRVYFLAVHNKSFNLSPAQGQALVDASLQVARRFESETPSMDLFLFEEGHSALKEERERCRAKVASRNKDKSDGDTETKTNKVTWPDLHSNMFKGAGLSWKDVPCFLGCVRLRSIAALTAASTAFNISFLLLDSWNPVGGPSSKGGCVRAGQCEAVCEFPIG